MIVDLDISGEKTMFSGSSEEDMAYAKTFWQSVQLMPPMESRLVSCDIKQRLKKAPPGSQPVNIKIPGREPPQKLQQFLEDAKLQEKAQEWEKLQKLSRLRDEDIQLINKHRLTRIEKE